MAEDWHESKEEKEKRERAGATRGEKTDRLGESEIERVGRQTHPNAVLGALQIKRNRSELHPLSECLMKSHDQLADPSSSIGVGSRDFASEIFN